MIDGIRFAGMDFKGKSSDFILTDREYYFLVITANAEIINLVHENDRFKSIANEAICTIDGQVPFVLAKLFNRNKFNLDKISGSEFIFELAEVCELRKRKLFVLGGNEDANNKAVERLKSEYEIDIEGYSPDLYPYPFPNDVNSEIKERIQEFRPDYLAICFNAEKTNYWADDHADFIRDCGVRFSIGIGGTVDMLSGKVKRAPKIIQVLGLESIYRLVKEPRIFRLKRLLISMKIFGYMFKK